MSDIYSAPGSALTEPVAAGEYGSLERGVAGDYNFVIGDVLREAWEKTKGAKGTIFLACLIYGAILIVVSMALGLLNVATGGTAGSIALQVVTQLVTTAISMPMAAGLTIIGVRRSVGAPITPGLVLRYFNILLPLFGLTLLMYVMVILGYLLLILPGIYLSVAYYLAIPLMIDKNLGAWAALETSRKAITKRWFAVFGFLLLLGLINLATIVTLFIGMIWTIPMSLIAMGIFYRNVFGVEPTTLNP